MDFKKSKTFTVAHTELYEPEYGIGEVSAALIIPDDYFTIEKELSELSVGEIEGKHSDVYLDVFTVNNLSFEEAFKLYKEYSDKNFNDFLWDYYLENVETKNNDDDLWNHLENFQNEINKMPTYKVEILLNAMNRLKAENLTDDSQHNKDVLTILNYLTEELK